MTYTRSAVVDLDVVEFLYDPNLAAHKALTALRKEVAAEGLQVTGSPGVIYCYVRDRDGDGELVPCDPEDAHKVRMVARVEID